MTNNPIGVGTTAAKGRLRTYWEPRIFAAPFESLPDLTGPMSDLSDARNALLAFRHARGWNQSNSPKDLAAALSIEAAELLELFLWKEESETDVANVREELADVLAYSILMADHYGLDLAEILMEKVRLNEER